MEMVAKAMESLTVVGVEPGYKILLRELYRNCGEYYRVYGAKQGMETFRKEIKSVSDLKNDDALKSEKKVLQLTTAVLGKAVVKCILDGAMAYYVETVADNTRKAG